MRAINGTDILSFSQPRWMKVTFWGMVSELSPQPEAATESFRRSSAQSVVDELGVRFEPVADERGHVPAVVDVRVGEHHGVDGAGWRRQVAVAILRILAASLIEAAIEKVVLAVDLQMAHGPGDGSWPRPRM